MPSRQPDAQTPSLCILVVDDEQQVREVMSAMLASRGHHAITAGSAREAMNSLQGIKADLAILDVCMPSVDGLELAVMIRGNDPAIHIIMMSGCCADESRKAAEDLGIESFINKPFHLEAIDAIVGRIGRLVSTWKIPILAQ